MRVSFLGLGEAGSIYASGFVDAGHHVLGFDPGEVTTPAGVERVQDLASAVHDSELVCAFVPGTLSVSTAQDAAPHLDRGCVYADFAAAAPTDMHTVEEIITSVGAIFADIAVLAPVPLNRLSTPLMISGGGAGVVHDAIAPMGAPIEVLAGRGGDASARKLLRSIFMKGFATVVCEAVAAGRAAGVEAWIRQQLAAELADGNRMIDRFIAGSQTHALRRSHEMQSVAEYLQSLGVPNEMSEASAQALTRMATDSRVHS
jgi:3-hydroxyisobutyrate dehydrogenase